MDRWFFNNPTATPQGMARVHPHTVNGAQGGGGLNYDYTEVLRISHLHGWMTGGLEVMPVTGTNWNVTTNDQWNSYRYTRKKWRKWKSSFSHATEIIVPGYHKFYLDKYNKRLEPDPPSLFPGNRVLASKLRRAG